MILLLSDNEKTATPIREDLSKEGFKIELVDDFSKALYRLSQENHYELILLDFEYSRHDVFEVCQKIKRNVLLKFIPLICIVDKNRIVDQLLAFEMGADDFIFFPYSTLEIQLKVRSIHRITELQNQLQQKDAQVENLKNIQRIMVTLNHYINNALTPLYFSVQMADNKKHVDDRRMREIAKETVEFISKVLQSLHEIVHSGKIKILQDGVYKDIMLDIEQELNKLMEKTQ